MKDNVEKSNSVTVIGAKRGCHVIWYPNESQSVSQTIIERGRGFNLLY